MPVRCRGPKALVEAMFETCAKVTVRNGGNLRVNDKVAGRDRQSRLR
jgi:hypothetical protein